MPSSTRDFCTTLDADLGMVAQNVGAALDQYDARAYAVEKLSELAGNDSATENDHALGDEIEIEHVVARPRAGGGQSRHGRDADLGACADQKMARTDAAAVGEFELVRIGKAGMGANEFEFSRLERGLTIGGELANDFLSRVDRPHVGPG